MQPIQLKFRCGENINEMSLSNDGHFCDSCQRNVVDFRNYSESEIKSYFEKSKELKVCGAFHPGQINQTTDTSSNWIVITFSKIGILIFLMLQKLETEAQAIKPTTVQTEKKADTSSPENTSTVSTSIVRIKGKVTSADDDKSLAVKKEKK